MQAHVKLKILELQHTIGVKIDHFEFISKPFPGVYFKTQKESDDYVRLYYSSKSNSLKIYLPGPLPPREDQTESHGRDFAEKHLKIIKEKIKNELERELSAKEEEAIKKFLKSKGLSKTFKFSVIDTHCPGPFYKKQKESNKKISIYYNPRKSALKVYFKPEEYIQDPYHPFKKYYEPVIFREPEDPPIKVIESSLIDPLHDLFKNKPKYKTYHVTYEVPTKIILFGIKSKKKPIVKTENFAFFSSSDTDIAILPISPLGEQIIDFRNRSPYLIF
mmetsp:Transcript_4446/g.6523  ORF Transcript_4446/g.6523 Transcript_4446/m.6523 type:complete len:275 (-) Transcript_4446:171-995(-)